MPRNYSARTLSYVTVAQGVNIKYGFWSGLKTSLRDNYGQTEIIASTKVEGLVIGANSPKPYRASTKSSSGYESSWCSHDKVAALKKAGYQVLSPKVRSASVTKLSKTVYVTINGIKYAWQMPLPPSGVDLTALGVKDATANDNDLVFGASFPKPPRVSKLIQTTDGGGLFSSFCDPSKLSSLPDGWLISEPAKTTLLI